MKHKLLTMAVAAGLGFGLTGPAVSDHPDKTLDPGLEKYTAGDKRSGYTFAEPETRAIQDDDFENPAMLWIERGGEMWSKVEGEAGKSCASCHQDAETTMKGVGATYPKFDQKAGKVVNLEQRINMCRTENMKAEAWKYESDPLLGMTGFVKMQSRGMPVNVSVEGPAKASFERGKALYYQRRGQLDMACKHCHEDNEGNFIRTELLSQGMSNGFPTYRLKWQKLGSLHRRMRGCNKQIRAEPFPFGAQEYVDIELFLAWRAAGLPVETPSVRK